MRFMTTGTIASDLYLIRHAINLPLTHTYLVMAARGMNGPTWHVLELRS